LEQTIPSKENEGNSILDDAKVLLGKGLTYLSTVDWKQLLRNPGFWFVIGSIAGFVLMFSNLLRTTGQKWMNDDYYSHGFIVPFLIAWQIKIRYKEWSEIPIKPGYAALIAFIPIVFFQFIAFIGEFWVIQCILLVSTILTGLWLIFGFKRAWFITMPIVFLLFALPVWGSFIDGNTNSLQLLSTTVAEKLLSLFGFNPLRLNGTDLQLNSYALTVAVPCSGLKLMVAVACFTAHFVLIARKEFSFNFLMFVLVVPLCLFINGLRIALIGVVGELRGGEAAMAFHDYSGYLTLLICFYILFKFARLFGWKD
jgi:exosortase